MDQDCYLAQEQTQDNRGLRNQLSAAAVDTLDILDLWNLII